MHSTLFAVSIFTTLLNCVCPYSCSATAFLPVMLKTSSVSDALLKARLAEFGCKLSEQCSSGHRQFSRRRLDLRGTATLQIRAKSSQLPSEGTLLIPGSPLQPVIVCGPSGVGKVTKLNKFPHSNTLVARRLCSLFQGLVK